MKIFINFLMLLIVSTVLAQKGNPNNFYPIQVFVGVSADVKMAVVGPFSGQENDIGTTLNIEFVVGWEQSFNHYNGLRVSHKYEIHPAIKYAKATWLAADYVLKDHLLWFNLDNFSQYAGVEISTIYRTDPNFNPLTPGNYIEKTVSRINPGVNFEIQYHFSDNISLGAGYNIFRAEQLLIDDGKNIRTDGMLSLYYKL